MWQNGDCHIQNEPYCNPNCNSWRVFGRLEKSIFRWNVGVNGVKNSTSKILAFSDIILTSTEELNNAESSNGRTFGFGPKDF